MLFIYKTLIFKILAEEATNCFLNALKNDPKNKKLGEKLFGCYVRENNLINQQKFSLNLQKSFKDNKYIFWAVMSQFIQIRDQNKQSLLPLATKFIEKLFIDSTEFTFERTPFLFE